MPEPTPVAVLFGPTGSGKTALLEQLFLENPAFSGRAEIVSSDSMQVYRGMDIGTAKPSPELQALLPHHLIDILDPWEPFNVGEFVRLADRACTDIASRGAAPVVSGGAGFYLTRFIRGLPGAPPSDRSIRRKLREELNTGGVDPLIAELQARDPESAFRIHRNDVYRLLRALEVIRLSGRPLSSFSLFSEGSRPAYRFIIIGLERARSDLYRRIDLRCAAMFRAGLPEEVRRLFDAGYTPRDPGLRAIGYKEFFEEAPDGTYRLKEDPEPVAALIRRNCRRYAKRQITCFSAIPGVLWISAEDDPARHITRALHGFFP
ncbi:MAG: tRNA (adenosine(37)-N6)-dimethylallyltransferase MiaA [Spirochaetaceae bacterium]|jgi:tRNA dimethylallyltransferase|nr:tRNA (adenosine(37)-N6)-dimethylallyltransferase MiaA [Spirochaetaceae bacterium]